MLPIADLESLNEKVFQSLVIGMPESNTLDFKLQTYGSDDASKREFCKDLSALANSSGGDLVIGIREEDDVATEVVGISVPSITEEIQRLQNVALSSIEPRVLGLRFASIELSTKRYLIIIRVPRSLDLPHRVTHSRINRFYVRHTTDSLEASLGELRTMFDLGATEFDRAVDFHKERFDRVSQQAGPVALAEGSNGFYVLHILPFGFGQRRMTTDIGAFQRSGQFLMPPGAESGIDMYFHAEGYVTRRGRHESYGYTLMMRNGVVEATRSNIINSLRDGSARVVRVEALCNELTWATIGYFNVLRRTVGQSGPWLVMLGLGAMKGARFWLSGGSVFEGRIDTGAFPSFSFHVPAVIVDTQTTNEEIHKAIKPILDVLWQGAGQPGAPAEWPSRR